MGVNAFSYPTPSISSGHSVAFIPGVPGGPIYAISACSAVNSSTELVVAITVSARLAETAYELVDGIPNG